MKKRWKAAGAACLFLLLALAVLPGLTRKQTEEKEERDPDAVSIWYPGGYEILSNMELNDVWAVEEMENRLDVSLDFSGNTGDLDSSFQTLLLDLSGTDAVFYRFSAEQLRSMAENGQALDYTPYLDQMPNLKKRFAENPLLYQYASVDGQCLFFPSLVENSYQDILLGIRKDWLDQVGADKPESVEELAEILLWQKNLYAQGELENQGEYFIGLSSYNEYANQLMRVFGTDSGVYWNEEKTGLVYGPATEEYRNYLIFLKSLYQAEMLDAGLYETETTDFEKYFLNNMSSTILTTGEQAQKLEKYAAANGDDIVLEYVNLDTLSGETPAIYRTAHRQNQVLEYGFVINADISQEKLDMLLKMIDYLYSDEGMELMNWGLEGEHWIMENGERVYNPDCIEDGEYYAIAMARYLKQDMLCTDRTANRNMLDSDVRAAVDEASYQEDYSFDEPRGYYTKEQEDRLDTLEISLSTFVEETTMNFIYSSIDPSDDGDWQDYLDTLESFGMEEYLEIQLDAWERMQLRQYEGGEES